jgi:hypothetical protein
MIRLYCFTTTLIVYLSNQCMELNAFLNKPTTITTKGGAGKKQRPLLKPLKVSEFHIPAYRGLKRKFVLTEKDLLEPNGSDSPVLTRIEERRYSPDDYTSIYHINQVACYIKQTYKCFRNQSVMPSSKRQN